MTTGLGNSVLWLGVAGAAIWLGIGCYVAFIAFKQRGLALKLKQLEQLRHDVS